MSNPFDSCSSEYNRFRPEYPAELYDYLIQSRPSHVLDVGAGTGKGAVPFLKRGVDVICAEPSAEMAGEGRTANPSLNYVRGHAEALPFRSEAFDLVTAAQCFHWFRADAALPELARVLAANGRFAVFWNSRDQSMPHTQAFERLVMQFNPEHRCEYRKRDWGEIISSTGHFKVVDVVEFRFVRPMSVEDWIGLSRSISYIRVIGDARMVEFEKALHDALQGFESVDLHYITDCWLASKSGR